MSIMKFAKNNLNIEKKRKELLEGLKKIVTSKKRLKCLKSLPTGKHTLWTYTFMSKVLFYSAV